MGKNYKDKNLKDINDNYRNARKDNETDKKLNSNTNKNNRDAFKNIQSLNGGQSN